MILSDREIRATIRRGGLSIDPPPDATAFASTAVDLRLDATVQVWNPMRPNPTMGLSPCFCPAEDGFNVRKGIEEHTRLHDLRKDGPLRLGPTGRPAPAGAAASGFILGWTLEKIRIPHSARLCARVEGKSSLARLGLGVHVTAPTIHAGFGAGRGDGGDALQLEIWNVGPLPIELRYEMAICQLIFEEVHGTPDQGCAGQFLDQGPK